MKNTPHVVGVRHRLHGGHGNLELEIAKSTDSDGEDCAKPFDDPKTTLWHCHLSSAFGPTSLAMERAPNIRTNDGY
jgi:hypothetical protein